MISWTISSYAKNYISAWETPFANGPLKEYIGDYRLGQGATEILEGDFDPNKSENIPAVNY
eukprot:984244-Ditylum_brightwellii.AAC.1